METKINIAELLKDCPKGMELNCLLCNTSIALEGVVDESTYPIRAVGKNGFRYSLTKYGTLYDSDDAKCIIFPKGKTTWKGFQKPFKDGDIVATGLGSQVFILQRMKSNTEGYCYMGYDFTSNRFFNANVWSFERLASEEEKTKLFKAIKDNGYHWNAETKTLEKLPKFKVGDRVKKGEDKRLTTIQDVRDNYYIITIPDYFGHCCITDKLPFSKQDEYELVTDKFNINALNPFDKVLVRGNVGQKWIIDFFGFMDNDKGLPFVCVGHYVIQCIPYEGNEHLLGTTNDCDDFYRTWE